MKETISRAEKLIFYGENSDEGITKGSILSGRKFGGVCASLMNPKLKHPYRISEKQLREFAKKTDELSRDREKLIATMHPSIQNREQIADEYIAAAKNTKVMSALSILSDELCAAVYLTLNQTLSQRGFSKDEIDIVAGALDDLHIDVVLASPAIAEPIFIVEIFPVFKGSDPDSFFGSKFRSFVPFVANIVGKTVFPDEKSRQKEAFRMLVFGEKREQDGKIEKASHDGAVTAAKEAAEDWRSSSDIWYLKTETYQNQFFGIFAESSLLSQKVVTEKDEIKVPGMPRRTADKLATAKNSNQNNIYKKSR